MKTVKDLAGRVVGYAYEPGEFQAVDDFTLAAVARSCPNCSASPCDCTAEVWGVWLAKSDEFYRRQLFSDAFGEDWNAGSDDIMRRFVNGETVDQRKLRAAVALGAYDDCEEAETKAADILNPRRAKS